MILKKLKPLQPKYLILIINRNRLKIQQNLKNLKTSKNVEWLKTRQKPLPAPIVKPWACGGTEKDTGST